MDLRFPSNLWAGTSSWSSRDFNNHYAGYAPGSLELFHRLFWAEAQAAASG